MNQFYERALEIKEEIVANRRTIHGFGGTGFDLPDTTKFVMGKLRELGLAPKEICKSGVVCTIGSGGKTILPQVDAALGMHVGVGRPDSYSGLVTYIIGPASTSADEFWITIDTHEQRMVSPITAGCRLIEALQEISNFEIRPNEFFSMVCNVFDCNSDAANVTPTKAVIKGVIRTTDPEIRATAKARLEQLTEAVTKAYRCTGEIEYVRGVGPMLTSRPLCEELAGYAEEIVGPENMVQEEYGQGAEDFSAVCREVDGMFINLGAGHPSEGYTAANHKSTVIFNEEVLPTGSAIYANCAFQWLKNHAE